MASHILFTAPSPWQTLNGQGVLRIPTKRARTHPKVENRNPMLKIGTWNAKSLFAAGKTHNIINEMKRMNINILGVSETRWPGSNQINIDDYTMYYSGNDEPHHYNGVAIIMDKGSNRAVKNFVPISDRVALLQVKSSPRDINIIQVYAPTKDKPEAEILQFYSDIKLLLKTTRKNEVNIIMGDFNAKVGKGRVEEIVGNYGLGDRNERGDLLVQFCQEEKLMIANTWFQLPERRLYTWKAPGDSNNNIKRNQIDYILMDKRYRNGIKGVKTYPGADIGSDHNPVIGTLEIRLKKVKRNRILRPNFKLLQNTDTREKVAEVLNSQLNNAAHALEQENVENSWQTFKTIVSQVQADKLQTDNDLGKREREWMTPEILRLMEERRGYKSKNEIKYRETHRLITQLIRKAKEKWMEDRCRELEELQDKHDYFNIHKKIAAVTGQKNRTFQFKTIKTNENKLLTDQESIETEWTQYVHKLFDDERTEPNMEPPQEPTPNILTSEIAHAIKLAKTQKAPGPDDTYVEMLKLLNDDGIKLLTQLINKTYESGILPRDWLRSIFIPIPKKNGANKCSQFRLISLMSHTLKIVLKVIHQRIYRKCEQNISDEQFGFRQGLGTREALFCLTVLLQKCRDQSNDVYLCFIDYEKAFDRIKHTELINLLNNQGLDSRDITLIKSLYWEQSASIRIGDGVTSDIPVKRGVRQGCVLSPLLFNLYSEKVFQNALENLEDGIKVNGKIINNIRYADDTVIIANSPEGLQRLMDAITREGDALGLRINTDKTKTMVVSKNPNLGVNINIYNKQIENVTKFKYLGSWITKDLDPEVEIRARIEYARSAFMKMKGLLSNSALSLKIRYRFVKTYIYSILLYGVESWTLGIKTMRRLEAFEMWSYRRLLKISWTEHISNEIVLQRMGKDRKLLGKIKRRKTGYLGHIYRGRNYEFLRLVMEGKIEGKRGIGRRKCSWLRNIREWTGMDTPSLLRTAQDRQRFAEVVADLQ